MEPKWLIAVFLKFLIFFETSIVITRRGRQNIGQPHSA